MNEEKKESLDNLLNSVLTNELRLRHKFNVLFSDLDKKPYGQWKKWQTKEQTDEDILKIFETYKKRGIANWGFVCGYNDLLSFDFDWAWVFRLWLIKFGNRGDTFAIRTPNGGARPYFIVSDPQTDDTFEKNLHTEIKGKGCFVVHEGSAECDDKEIRKYTVFNDSKIKKDNNIFDDTLDFLEEAKDRYKFLSWKCFRQFFKDKMWPEVRHDVRLFICTIMAFEKFTYDEIFNFFMDFPDFDETKTDYQINYNIGRVEEGLKPPKCETLINKLNWDKKSCARCPRKKKLKDQKKTKDDSEHIIMTAGLVKENFIAEQVWSPPDAPQFVIKYFDKDEFVYVNEIRLGERDLKDREIIYIPIDNDHLRKGTVIIPRRPVKCTIDELFRDAVKFVTNDFDSCEKIEEAKLIIFIIMTSWILDKEKTLLPVAGVGVFAPIIPIRGPSGSGKNRFANLLRFLSYHPYFTVSTVRIPSLFRPLDLWKGTLVMDEGDFNRTGETAELIHFLNSRATGTPIGRQNPDKSGQCDVFSSFGQTIITQRRNFDDNATEGRSIEFKTDVSEDKGLSTLLPDNSIQNGMNFQDKLLYLRLMLWNKIEIDKNLRIENIDDHRLNSALLPLFALTPFQPDLEKFIQDSIQKVRRERINRKSESEDGVMINILWDKIDEGLIDDHNNIFYILNDKELIVEKDKEWWKKEVLTSKIIAERLGYKTGIRPRKVLTSLNIYPNVHPKKIRVGKKMRNPIFFDPIKLEKRLKEFVVDYKSGSLNTKLNGQGED